MKITRFYLKEYYPSLKYNPYIELSEIDHAYSSKKAKVAVIVAGGGYDIVGVREGDPICLEFLLDGYKSVKLVYSVDPINHSINYPNQVLELMAAVDFLKTRSDELNIDSDKIVLVGFSAGAHLVGVYSYLYKDIKLRSILEISGDIKPNGVVLSYPVVNLVGDTDSSTKAIITGNNKDLERLLSIDLNITNDYPPTYLWVTKSDSEVSVDGVKSLDRELCINKVKHKTHIFETGCHGLGLGTLITVPGGNKELVNREVQGWIDEAKEFLNEVL